MFGCRPSKHALSLVAEGRIQAGTPNGWGTPLPPQDAGALLTVFSEDHSGLARPEPLHHEIQAHGGPGLMFGREEPGEKELGNLDGLGLSCERIDLDVAFMFLSFQWSRAK